MPIIDRGHDNHGSVDNFIAEKANNMDVETSVEDWVTFERGVWTVDAFAPRFKRTGLSFP
jgi:hypothetical protein